MISPEFDSDGYPTDATLLAIEKWYIRSYDNCADLLNFCIEAWKYPVNQEAWLYEFDTGGWSGNEEIITAMQKNYIFWMFAWRASTRGGHYEFELHYPPEEEAT